MLPSPTHFPRAVATRLHALTAQIQIRLAAADSRAQLHARHCQANMSDAQDGAGAASAGTGVSSGSQAAAPQRVVIVPGNGCGQIQRANWYMWLKRALESRGYEVHCQSMPDPNEAKESSWIPFILDTLKADENTILVGHSSGAEAGMRLAEKHKLKGLILVSACHTDLGMESEAISGYYNRPWEWERIRANCQWIVQFHSTDDPFIPVAEARHVAKNLQSEYIEHTKRGHYLSMDMPDVVDIIDGKCKAKQY